MESPRQPLIRHVRYEDFVALISQGVVDLEGFRLAVDALGRHMGDVAAHHVLFDLRGADVGPLPEIVLVEALDHLRRRGVGVLNRLALVTDPADEERSDRTHRAEAIAAQMGVGIAGGQKPTLRTERRFSSALSPYKAAARPHPRRSPRYARRHDFPGIYALWHAPLPGWRELRKADRLRLW
jgi:hypothetical protein